MEESIRQRLVRSFQEYTLAWTALTICVGVILIILGNITEITFLSLSLVSVGSALIGIGAVSIIFRSASTFLVEKMVMERAVEETYRKMLFTYIPKFRIIEYTASVSICKDTKKGSNIPKMVLHDKRVLVNLHKRPVSQKLEKAFCIPEHQKYALKKVKVVKEKKSCVEFGEGDIPTTEIIETQKKTPKTRSYEYVIPFGCSLKQNEEITIEETYEVSPCNALPGTNERDERIVLIDFPAEKLLIEIEAKDGFYLKDIKHSALDKASNEQINTISAPEYEGSEGKITKVSWNLETRDLAHMNYYGISFLLGLK